MRALVVSSCCLALVACRNDRKDVIAEGPPAPVTAPAASSVPPAPAAPVAPVRASFVQPPEAVKASPCEETFLAVAKGATNVLAPRLGYKASLGAGDVLVLDVSQPTPVDMEGAGLVVVATTASRCDAPDRQTIVRATQAPELTFMKGAMHAHLDLDDRAVAPTLYLGRLSGTAGVPEHSHAGSWEILCALEASGTFTLGGVDKPLSPRMCVSVPPDVKHSWKPDPGSNLVAVQIYAPPGPEQRFKQLAAATSDAGK
jgi:mannose-6-phosphate isomerase-like protein (cupin superfamily)